MFRATMAFNKRPEKDLKDHQHFRDLKGLKDLKQLKATNTSKASKNSKITKTAMTAKTFNVQIPQWSQIHQKLKHAGWAVGLQGDSLL